MSHEERSLDQLAADIKAAQATLDTATASLQNKLSALNIEFPEDETEGDSDRKMSARKAEDIQTTDAVWHGVQRVDAKLIPAFETMQQWHVASRRDWDEARIRAQQVFDDGLTNIAKINKGLIDHTHNSMQTIVTGDNINSRKEIAGESALYDYMKQANNAIEAISARLKTMEELFSKNADKS